MPPSGSHLRRKLVHLGLMVGISTPMSSAIRRWSSQKVSQDHRGDYRLLIEPAPIELVSPLEAWARDSFTTSVATIG